MEKEVLWVKYIHERKKRQNEGLRAIIGISLPKIKFFFLRGEGD
jgi:hypothetical protein